MSLINDALKKAQRQRSDGPALPDSTEPVASAKTPSPAAKPAEPASTPKPTPGNEIARPATPATPAAPQGATPPVARPATTPAFKYPSSQTQPAAWKISTTPPFKPSTTGTNSPHPRSSSKPSFKYQTSSSKEPVSPMTLWLWLGGIALVLLSGGVTLSIMNAPTTPATPAPVVQPVLATPAPQAAPRPITPPAPPPVIADVTPTPAPSATVAIPPAEPAARPEPTIQEPAKPVATAATAEATVAPAPGPAATLPPLYAPRAPAPANPSVRVQNFVNRLRVTGIRLSDTGTKVILGDRLFKVGEIVDTGLELRLIKAEEGVLTFADATGKTYIKVF